MKPEILEVEQLSEDLSNKGSHVQWWAVRYRIGGETRMHKCSFGLTAQGRFGVALRKHELFKRIRVTIASDWLVLLIQELGDDAVKQAFEEAVVKSVAEA